jgi:KDO2-lipid IV(A) lauroyltransferase
VSVFYYLIRGGGFILGQIPLFILYPLSDFLAWIASDVIHYRYDVVQENLRQSFPGLSEQERKKLSRKFYVNFTDVLVESFKMLSRNPKLITSRVQILNPELLKKYQLEMRSIVAVSSHYGNWEWMGVGLQELTGIRCLLTYKPLSSSLMERLMMEIRQLNGGELVSMQQTFRAVSSSKTPVLSLLISDQAPHPENAYWTKFLHQDTPVFMGAERIAKATNSVVVFIAMRRVKRGYYTLEFQELTKEPKSEKEFAITEMHVRALEKLIFEDPSNWLWTHKRWKHKRNL